MTRRLSPAQTVIAAILAIIVIVNLLVAAVGQFTNEPSGKASSSYATSPPGVAAYSELLVRAGHPVKRIRGSFDESELDRGSTVIVLDGDPLSADDADALATFVEDGGRLVLGGSHREVLTRLLDDPPRWSDRTERRASPIAPLPDGADITEIELAGLGVWEDPGETLPVLVGIVSVVAVAARAGQGSIILLADSSPLQNRLLDRAGNASLGLAAAGADARPVAFVETVHGYGRSTGLAAIPRRWNAALIGLFFAALLFMWARGRRLGPAETDSPVHDPPRREYVESLGALLVRTRPRGRALEPLQAAARDRVARRAGLPHDADTEQLRIAAHRFGLTEEEIDAILGPVSKRSDMLAAGTALARLERGEIT